MNTQKSGAAAQRDWLGLAQRAAPGVDAPVDRRSWRPAHATPTATATGDAAAGAPGCSGHAAVRGRGRGPSWQDATLGGLTVPAAVGARTRDVDAGRRAPRPLTIVRLDPWRFEGGDIVPAPRPLRVDASTAAPRDDLATPTAPGWVIHSVAEARQFGLGAHTARPFYFVGYGHRSEATMLSSLATRLNAVVIALPLHDPTFFHIDTCVTALPDGVVIFPEALSRAGRELIEYLYAPHVLQLTPAEGLAFGANGRLLKRGANDYVYFYTVTALQTDFFTRVAALYPGSTLLKRAVQLPSGDDLTEHRLQYHRPAAEAGGQESAALVTVTFVPMPTGQALLGGGSISCLTLVTPQREVIMTDPAAFALSPGQNPLEDRNLGALDAVQLRREFAQQLERLRAYGFRVLVQPADPNLHEQIYTRDTGQTFVVDRAGVAWDPAAFLPEPYEAQIHGPAMRRSAANPRATPRHPDTTAACLRDMLVVGNLRHPVRQGEAAAMVAFFQAQRRGWQAFLPPLGPLESIPRSPRSGKDASQPQTILDNTQAMLPNGPRGTAATTSGANGSMAAVMAPQFHVSHEA